MEDLRGEGEVVRGKMEDLRWEGRGKGEEGRGENENARVVGGGGERWRR